MLGPCVAKMTHIQSGGVRAIDSRTGGEPARFVLGGGPDLAIRPLSERLERFRGQHDSFLSAVANQPRGSEVMVGRYCARRRPLIPLRGSSSLIMWIISACAATGQSAWWRPSPL
jgi:hypothetical protein